MIYFYKVRVAYIKGKQEIIKDYKCDFIHLGALFVHLEQFHHLNYKLIYVKEDRKEYLYHGYKSKKIC